MAGRDPIIWWPAIIAAILQAIVWSEWVATQAPELLALAAMAQLSSGLAGTGVMARDRRLLATILAVGVPILGPLAIPYVNAASRGGEELLFDPTSLRCPVADVEIAHRLAASVPPCEAILSRNVDARRATIARLAERATAADIAVLRWVLAQRDPEIAIEAALALEEAGQQFERRMQAVRAAATTAPSFDHHATVVRVICEGIRSGIIEPMELTKLTSEARHHHEAALEIDSTQMTALAVWRARIELAVRQPAAALLTIKSVISKSADEEIIKLYIEAAYAARRFELAGLVGCGAPDVAA